MNSENKYKIIWLNSDIHHKSNFTYIIISNKRVSMQNRCMDYYRITENDIRELSKCIPNLKIVAAYRNPRGGDFIVYNNGLVSDINYENRIGTMQLISEIR